MRISCIYQIQSKVHPERIYIGSASYNRSRWGRHIFDLRNNQHDNGRLQNHFNKYGEDDLIFTVIESCEKEDLIKREQYYIDTLNPYFNISKIAGSTLGYKHSEETRKKLSEMKKNHIPWNKGKKLPSLTEEQRRNISERLIGNEYAKGYKHSEETKQKERGRIPWNKGLSPSKETREKISNTLLSKHMSSWNKGIKHSEEAIRKMSEARKNYYQIKKIIQ